MPAENTTYNPYFYLRRQISNGGGGGLDYVSHDTNFTGDGTDNFPLCLAPPLISTADINAIAV
jgi:hypothetical protein